MIKYFVVHCESLVKLFGWFSFLTTLFIHLNSKKIEANCPPFTYLLFITLYKNQMLFVRVKFNNFISTVCYCHDICPEAPSISQVPNLSVNYSAPLNPFNN